MSPSDGVPNRMTAAEGGWLWGRGLSSPASVTGFSGSANCGIWGLSSHVICSQPSLQANGPYQVTFLFRLDLRLLITRAAVVRLDQREETTWHSARHVPALTAQRGQPHMSRSESARKNGPPCSGPWSAGKYSL